MTRGILVAFDLDESSQLALGRGVQLAQQTAANLLCLHVINESGPEALSSEEARLAKARMVASIERAPSLSPPGEARIDSGIVEERLLEAAEEHQAALIVTGKPRRRSIAGLFLGSTIERLLRYGSFPVLVTRSVPDGPYRRICLALDQGPVSASALSRVKQLGLLEEASIYAVHGVQAPGKLMMADAGIDRDEIAEHLARATSSAAAEIQRTLLENGLRDEARSLIVKEGNPVEVVMETLDAIGADLLVVGTRGSTGIRRLLLGSTAEALIAKAPCDVLVVPAPD